MYLIYSAVGYRALALNFLFAVVILGLFLGRGPVLFAATLSALLWNFLFLPPRFTVYIKSFEDGMMFAMYFVVAVVIGQLVSRLRTQEQAERRREERSTALYLLTREFADARTLDDIVKKLVAQIQQVFGAKTSVLLLGAGPKHPATAPHPGGTFPAFRKRI